MASTVKVVDREYLLRQFQNYNTNVVSKALEGKVDKVEGYGLSKNDFTDAYREKLESLKNYDPTEIEGRIESVENVLNTLTGDKDAEGSIAKMAADAVAEIVAGAPEDLDTLKEISDWISTHADSAAEMNSQILENKSSTETNAAAIEILNGDKDTEGSVANAIATAMLDIDLEDWDIDFNNLYATVMTREETVEAISTSIDDTGSWTNKGTVVKTGDTSYDYFVSSEEFAKDNKVVLNDCARFFGRLHDNGVDAVVYNGTTYTWDDTLTLKGSRFAKNGTTLMSVISGDVVDSLVNTGKASVLVKANGVDLDFTIQVSEPVAEISGEAEVEVGSSITLTSNAENVVWTSSDDEIATVENGVVTGVAAGEVTITATAEGYTPGTKSITVKVV